MLLLLSMPSGGEWLFLVIGFAILLGIIPYIFYLITLQNTLLQVSPGNRSLPPGQVWLLLIPLFNLVWQFIVVTRLADSIAAELRSRGSIISEKPGYSMGIAYCICFCCGWIPLLGTLASIAGLVLWIIYWVKINEYKNTLTRMQSLNPDQDSQIFNPGNNF